MVNGVPALTGQSGLPFPPQAALSKIGPKYPLSSIDEIKSRVAVVISSCVRFPNSQQWVDQVKLLHYIYIIQK
jgi:hypothetical protein